VRDRYSIARQHQLGLVMPLDADLAKYGKPEPTPFDVDKASLCAEIVMARTPGLSDREVARRAALLMHQPKRALEMLLVGAKTPKGMR
jgi:hypothetical protein